MIDDFDFEDDLGDLKEDSKHQDNSFFPPVKNSQSRLNQGFSPEKQSLSKIENKGSIFPQSIKSNKFNQSDKNSDDFGDEYGFDEIKPKAKPQVPASIPQILAAKPTINQAPLPQTTKPTILPNNVPSNKKVVDKFNDEKNNDYLNDFDGFDDSEDEKPKPKAVLQPKKQEPNPFPSPGFSKEIDDKVRSKQSNINIEDMIRVNSKLDKSSDFEDYNDDLSSLNRPQSPPEI